MILPLAALTSCHKKEEPPPVEQSDIWWGTERYVPTETEIAGIPVDQLSETWIKASALTPALLSETARNYLKKQTREDQVLSFDFAGDFNKDGRPDRALTGVYQTSSGETGEFFLIVTRADDGTWKKAALEVDPRQPGFSTVMIQDNEMFWLDCFECDGFPAVVWKDKKYVLEYPPDGESLNEDLTGNTTSQEGTDVSTTENAATKAE